MVRLVSNFSSELVRCVGRKVRGRYCPTRNLVPASDLGLADDEQPKLRQARLNGAGLQHTLSHYAVSSP